MRRHEISDIKSTIAFDSVIALCMSRVSCQVICLTYVSKCRYFYRHMSHYITELSFYMPQKQKGLWSMVAAYIIMVTTQYFCNKIWPNIPINMVIPVNMVSLDHGVSYCKRFYFRDHCTCNTQDLLCNLVSWWKNRFAYTTIADIAAERRNQRFTETDFHTV